MAPLPLSEHWSSRRPGETLTSPVLGAGSQWNTFTGTFSFPHVKSLPIGTTPHIELPAFWTPGCLFLFFSRDCGFVARPLARSHHVTHWLVGAGEAGGFLAPVLRYRHGAWRSPRSQPARGGGAPAPPSAPQALAFGGSPPLRSPARELPRHHPAQSRYERLLSCSLGRTRCPWLAPDGFTAFLYSCHFDAFPGLFTVLVCPPISN